jgi:hypothetical protein
MLRNLLVVLATLATVGSGYAQIRGVVQRQSQVQTQRFPAVTYSNVLSGNACNAQKTETFIIGNQGALNNYWNHTFGSLEGVPTDIAWAREMVAAVNLGPRNTNGGGVYFSNVVMSSAIEMQLTYTERVPPSWADVKPAQLSPFAIIRIKRIAAQKFTFLKGPNLLTPLAALASQGIGVRGGGYYDAPWLPYNTGGLCQAEDSYTGVIVDAPAFGIYWTTIFGPDAYVPSDVDFTNEQLVVLNLGRRPSTGYAAVVQGLKWISSTSVQVEWYEQTPAPGTMQAQHVTSPYTMVRIPSGNIQVTFKKIAPPGSTSKQ